MSDFYCVICGNSVSKRQSLAYKDGRACRHHPEVQQAKEEAEHEAELKRCAEKLEAARQKERFDPIIQARKAAEIREWADTHCWCCGKEGFTGQTFWLRMMIASKKLELKGQSFPLLGDQTKLLAEMGLTGKVAVLTYPLRQSDKLVRDDIIPLSRLIQLLQVCRECAMKSGRTDFDERFMPPPIAAEKLEKGMMAAVLMDPVITEVAAAEIREQAKMN